MIYHIAIKDFAIIQDAEVSFKDGLNIVTGETGSGKSILITAISLALGSRADVSFIRHGSERALVELVGELYGEEIVITREVNASGKNLCKLNGRLVALSELAETAALMADVHGQYDNQSLLNPDNHLEIVDNYKADTILPLREEYYGLYKDYTEAKSALGKLLSLSAENARKLDFYKYEIDEIDSANLIPGEDEELAGRINLLKNGEKVFAKTKSAYDSLDQDGGAYEGLGNAINSLETISSLSPDLEKMLSQLNDIYYQMEDVQGSLRELIENLNYSEAELDRAMDRQVLLEGLKKKYGSTIEEILEYREKIGVELNQIENFDDEKNRLQKAEAEALKKLMAVGEKLTLARKDAAEDLASKIEKELGDLNFGEARLSIEFTPTEGPTPKGLDQAEMLISTNLGEPLKPLVKVASGGEISRIMLAIKSITAAYDKIPTIIFDEIDQGISGKTAAVVGRKLKEIAAERQIICITHLPQIAACSDQSYRIYKESDDSNTYTHIEELDENRKVLEIARLLGGEIITQAAMDNAKELIQSSGN